jgi:hypothetical protein
MVAGNHKLDSFRCQCDRSGQEDGFNSFSSVTSVLNVGTAWPGSTSAIISGPFMATLTGDQDSDILQTHVPA